MVSRINLSIRNVQQHMVPSQGQLLDMYVQPRHSTLDGKSYDVYLEGFLKNKDRPLVFSLPPSFQNRFCFFYVIHFQDDALAFYKFLETTFPAVAGLLGTKIG